LQRCVAAVRACSRSFQSPVRDKRLGNLARRLIDDTNQAIFQSPMREERLGNPFSRARKSECILAFQSLERDEDRSKFLVAFLVLVDQLLSIAGTRLEPAQELDKKAHDACSPLSTA
jgi:hypothetical protein